MSFRSWRPVLAGLTALVAGSFVAGRAAAQAGNGADATVALRFGSPGIGLEVAKLLTGNLGLRVGGNLFSASTTGDNSNINYDIKVKLHSFDALLDLFPSKRGSFHLTGGVMTNPVAVDLTGKPSGSGSFTINGNQYTAAQVGTLTGEIKFPSAGPYAGLGFGTPAGRKGAIKFRFDIGAMFGKPDVTLTSTGASSNAQLQADLTSQVATTQADIRKSLKIFPVISFGLALHL